ncbi:MAG: four helix bundle protein [Bacteroidetes bacterium CG2_30_32_10]|nr:MAG: four helix bundle protein [Bacteroidetes bacterium CG2_30_32_10]
MEKKNIILDKSLEFALEIIKYSELLEEHKKYVIARQILKSGTSIGANISEAQSSESKADFIHKLKIAAKEAQETEYWLMLCNKLNCYPPNHLLPIKLEEIQKLFSSIISSAKKNSSNISS